MSSPSSTLVAGTMDFECTDPIASGSSLEKLTRSLTPLGVPGVMAWSMTDGEIPELPENANANGWRFSKVGLVIKARLNFAVSLPAEHQNNVSIGWSNSGASQAKTLVINASLAINACRAPKNKNQWLVYPGGFSYKAPSSLPLEITAGTSTNILNIPLGLSCR